MCPKAPRDFNVGPPSEESLFLAMRETGIDLEWRTAEIFERCGYSIHQNVRGERNFNDEDALVVTPESDVIAVNTSGEFRKVAFVECKGIQQSGHLVTVERRDGMMKIPHMLVLGDSVHTDESKCHLAGTKIGSTALIQTGDFFVPDANGSTKSKLRQANKDSNFHKALLQVNASVDANINRFTRGLNCYTQIVPIVVTNASIHCLNMLGRKSRVIPWALTLSPIEFSLKSIAGMMHWNGRPALTGIWVVNLDSLKDFLDRLDTL